MPENQKRESVGRREEDIACREHEARLDEIDKLVHTMVGWLKTSAVVFSLVGAGITYMGTTITAKLNSIETLLTDSKVMLMKHEQQILQLQNDVKDINDRHRWIDQNGINIGKPGRK